MNNHLLKIFSDADKIAKKYNHTELSTLHIFYVLLSYSNSDFVIAFQDIKVTLLKLEEFIRQWPSSVPESGLANLPHSRELSEVLKKIEPSITDNEPADLVDEKFFLNFVNQGCDACDFIVSIAGGNGIISQRLEGIINSRKYATGGQVGIIKSKKSDAENDVINLIERFRGEILVSLNDFENRKNQAFSEIENRKSNFSDHIGVVSANFSKEKELAVQDLKNRLIQGSATINLVAALERVESKLKDSWNWAHRLSFFMMLISVIGFSSFLIYLFCLLQAVFSSVLEIKGLLELINGAPIVEKLIHLAIYSVLFGSMAKGFSALIFLFLFFKLFSVGLSVFAQVKNKQSILTSLRAVCEITNAPMDPNLSELMRQSAQQILTPIKFEFSGKKQLIGEQINEILSNAKSVKESIA